MNSKSEIILLISVILKLPQILAVVLFSRKGNLRNHWPTAQHQDTFAKYVIMTLYNNQAFSYLVSYGQLGP